METGLMATEVLIMATTALKNKWRALAISKAEGAAQTTTLFICTPSIAAVQILLMFLELTSVEDSRGACKCTCAVLGMRRSECIN